MNGNESLRNLPSVDALLRARPLRRLVADAGQSTATALVREALAGVRERVLQGGSLPGEAEIVDEVTRHLEVSLQSSLRLVVNATGVIIHTNLGRAPLSSAAMKAAHDAAAGYSNLEYDLESGERGSRHAHIEQLLCRVTGAEAGIAVNNNAAALYMVLQALCHDREVVISRGQAVEIGGGFRVPDVMLQSGARLVEVGTTNRTYVSDYESAIGGETAALLRVHASNFKVIGFTKSASVEELASLAHARGLLMIDDLGSGALFDTTRFGLPKEPMVQESLAGGADLVLFSGDKLLGGPQAGVIVGRKDLIDQLRRHPLARVLRLDKVTIAALSATLMHYVRGTEFNEIPVLVMISRTASEVKGFATQLVKWIDPRFATKVPGHSVIGGGSLPEATLPTTLVAVREESIPPDRLTRDLRMLPTPIIARVAGDAVLLDPRTMWTVPFREIGLLVKGTIIHIATGRA